MKLILRDIAIVDPPPLPEPTADLERQYPSPNGDWRLSAQIYWQDDRREHIYFARLSLARAGKQPRPLRIEQRRAKGRRKETHSDAFRIPYIFEPWTVYDRLVVVSEGRKLLVHDPELKGTRRLSPPPANYAALVCSPNAPAAVAIDEAGLDFIDIESGAVRTTVRGAPKDGSWLGWFRDGYLLVYSPHRSGRRKASTLHLLHEDSSKIVDCLLLSPQRLLPFDAKKRAREHANTLYIWRDERFPPGKGAMSASYFGDYFGVASFDANTGRIVLTDFRPKCGAAGERRDLARLPDRKAATGFDPREVVGGVKRSIEETTRDRSSLPTLSGPS